MLSTNCRQLMCNTSKQNTAGHYKILNVQTYVYVYMYECMFLRARQFAEVWQPTLTNQIAGQVHYALGWHSKRLASYYLYLLLLSQWEVKGCATIYVYICSCHRHSRSVVNWSLNCAMWLTDGHVLSSVAQKDITGTRSPALVDSQVSLVLLPVNVLIYLFANDTNEIAAN